MTKDNILADKSIVFAIRMTKCYKFLMEDKQDYIMSKQLFRSGIYNKDHQNQYRK